MTHTLTIEAWRPTPLNELLGNPFRAGRLKKADRKMVAGYAARDRTPLATTKRRVDLHVVPGPKQRAVDPDTPETPGAARQCGLGMCFV